MTPVLVIWEDAQLDADYDGPASGAPDTIVLMACGFLVKKTSKSIKIAMDCDPNTENVRFIFSIPAKMVREIRPLYEHFPTSQGGGPEQESTQPA